MLTHFFFCFFFDPWTGFLSSSEDKTYAKLFNQEPYKLEVVESEGVSTSFFMVGENKIELLEATNPDSAIAKYIEKKGEGIHHVAFDVEDIYAEMERLRKEGFTILNEEPKKGIHLAL